MTRKQIATPRCETISKLVVSVGSGWVLQIPKEETGLKDPSREFLKLL